MTTLTVRGGLLPTTSQLPSSANLSSANVTPRRGARRRPHHDCSRRLRRSGLSRSCSSRRRMLAAVAWIVLQGDLSDGLVRISQWTPASDNELGPTDQDSRTSFPDKGGRSLRGRMLRERPPLRLGCAATPRRRSTRRSRNFNEAEARAPRMPSAAPCATRSPPTPSSSIPRTTRRSRRDGTKLPNDSGPRSSLAQRGCTGRKDSRAGGQTVTTAGIGVEIGHMHHRQLGITAAGEQCAADKVAECGLAGVHQPHAFGLRQIPHARRFHLVPALPASESARNVTRRGRRAA
jgi:hypothetical protein